MSNMKINIIKMAVFLMTVILNVVLFFCLRRAILNALGCSVGKNSTIHRGISYFSIKGLSVGEFSTINKGCYIDSRGGLTIGNNVNISHDVKIYTAGHDIKKPHADFFTKSVNICDDVWIFPNCLVMPGVKIGRGAVIYPGTVVVKDVKDYEIVAGNPAKCIGVRPKEILYTANFPVWFGI